MPGTRLSSAADRKGPRSSRYRTIAAARAGPMPGRESSWATVAVLSGRRSRAHPTPSALPVSDCAPEHCGAVGPAGGVPTWSGRAGRASNAAWGSRVRRRPGPTPGTRSSPARLPNGPRAARSAAIRFARAIPTRGSLAISGTLARSRLIRSPAASGRESAAILSRWAAAEGAPSGRRLRIWTAPAASPGPRSASRTPWPATASASRTRSGRGGMPQGRAGEPPLGEQNNAPRRVLARADATSGRGAARAGGPPWPRPPRPEGSPRSPWRGRPPACARRDSRSPPRQSPGCRPAGARRGHR
jgi:hypothetical protein